ncbi:MAG TPA: PilZ domain-containing protein [Polyangia bacterium]|jgi:hypothetical protein|nr:PilZ domain-containing protein [Polyangia bacterium]
MNTDTKTIWGTPVTDRRGITRVPVDFYAVELSAGARYLRRICNVAGRGLLLADPLTEKKPGAIIHLELPRIGSSPLTVDAEVVRVTDGAVGVRTLAGGASLEGLGGRIDL